MPKTVTYLQHTWLGTCSSQPEFKTKRQDQHMHGKVLPQLPMMTEDSRWNTCHIVMTIAKRPQVPGN